MRYEGESPQIPTAEAIIDGAGRISSYLRCASGLICLTLPEPIESVEIDPGRLADGLDTVASAPIRDGRLYLRTTGGIVHNLTQGFGTVKRTADPAAGSESPDVAADARDVPAKRGRPRKEA